MRDSADFDDYGVTRRGKSGNSKKRGKFYDDEAVFAKRDRQSEILIPNGIRSVKRVSDPDPGVVLAVSEVLRQDFSTAHGARGFNDRGVPVRKLEPLARVQRRRQDGGRDVLNGEAAERLDEPDGLLVRNGVRPTGPGGLHVELLQDLNGQCQVTAGQDVVGLLRLVLLARVTGDRVEQDVGINEPHGRGPHRG